MKRDDTLRDPRPAGTDVAVSSDAVANVALVAARPIDGTSGSPDFELVPTELPMTVSQVDPNGPAAASGMLVGDQLVSIDGASLQGMLPLGAMIAIQLNHRETSSCSASCAAGWRDRYRSYWVTRVAWTRSCGGHIRTHGSFRPVRETAQIRISGSSRCFGRKQWERLLLST